MSDGKNGAIVSLREAGGTPGAGRPAARHNRAPLPVDRSILWTPNRDPGAPEAPAVEGPYELFITRSTLRGMAEHAAADARESRFGFLLGHLYRCPDTGVHYAAADRCLPSDEPFSEEAPDPFLLRAWADCQRELRAHGGYLLGWYHSHYLLGLFQSEGDRQTNSNYFDAPWQCAVLLIPDPDRPMGAVFRPSAGIDAGGEEPAAFRELLAIEDVPDSGALMSALAWTNYRPDREVKPAPAEEGGHGLEAPPVQPIPADPGRAPGAVSLVLPENRPPHRYPVLTPGRRKLAWVAGAIALGIGGFFGGMQLFRSESPPPAIPGPALRDAPEASRFRNAAVELQEAMLRYEERKQDFDLGRIGCRLLASGYAATDDAFIAMAGAFAALGSEADEARTAEYEGLVEDMNLVNVHFDGSACPRPE